MKEFGLHFGHFGLQIWSEASAPSPEARGPEERGLELLRGEGSHKTPAQPALGLDDRQSGGDTCVDQHGFGRMMQDGHGLMLSVPHRWGAACPDVNVPLGLWGR